MLLTRDNASLDISSIILLVLMISALPEIACTQSKPTEQNAVTSGARQGNPPRGGTGVASVTLTSADDGEVMITLNPCKGETPGNVLGISEQLETARRVAGFVAKLRDPAPKTRACAARQLGYLGAEAKDALPHIIKRMREEEHAGASVNVSEALWSIGPDTKLTIDEWLESLHAVDADVRLYAAFALGYYRPHPARQKEIVRALANATRDRDRTVRWMAVQGLVRLGPSASEAMTELLVILLDEKSPLRHRAATALGNIGPQAEIVAPQLLKVLYTTEDFTLYISTKIALGRIGPAAIVPLLKKDFDQTKALRILDVLQHLAPNGVQLLVEALSMKNKEVRAKALDIVWHFGPAAAPAVPLMIKELKDSDKDLREKAAMALSMLGPTAKASAPALLKALRDKESIVQCYAAQALGGLGADAAPAVPELQRLMNLPLEGEREIPQRCAAEALIKMGPETKALVPPQMVKRVEEFNRMIRSLDRSSEIDETKPKPKEKKEAPPREYE
jgi:HEAT repeat protein